MESRDPRTCSRMSLFIKCTADTDGAQSGPPSVVDSVWRRGGGRALLAARFVTGEVRCYDERGHEEPTKALQQVRGGNAHCIAWHPSAPILAVGWSNGCVTIWKHAEGRTETTDCAGEAAAAAIECVAWGAGGTRLATGTDSGLATIHKVDAIGRLTPLATSTSKSTSVTRAFALSTKGRRQQQQQQQQHDQPFLFEVSARPTAGDDGHLTHDGAAGAGAGGEIIMLSENGQRDSVAPTDSPLCMLSFAPKRKAVVALSMNGTLIVLVHQQPVGKWLSVAHLRLASAIGGSAQRQRLSAAMCTDDIIAFASTNDEFVRIYNIDTEDNFVLQLNRDGHNNNNDVQGGGVPEKDTITSLCFDAHSGLLAAGTSRGWVMMWKMTTTSDVHTPTPLVGASAAAEVDNAGHDTTATSIWEPRPALHAGSEIISMAASEGMRSLSACTDAPSMLVLRKYQLSRAASAGATVVQLGPSEIAVASIGHDASATITTTILKTMFQVFALRVTESHVMIFGDTVVEVYEMGVGSGEVSFVGSFENDLTGFTGARLTQKVGAMGYRGAAHMSAPRYIDNSVRQLETVSAHGDCVYRTSPESGGCVEVCNASGVVKQSLSCEQTYGFPTCLSSVSCAGGTGYLVVSMAGSYVMLWRLGGREVKKVFAQPRRVEPKSRLGQVLSLRCNCNGSKISILRESEDNRETDSRLLIYDIESDVTFEYDFGVDGRVPENHVWDAEDPRLLACETRNTNESSCSEVYTLFATQEHGILLQEKLQLVRAEGLLCLRAPFVYFFLSPPSHASEVVEAANDIGGHDASNARTMRQKNSGGTSSKARVRRQVLRDFKGMEGVDDSTRKALLNFSYSLATGSMEEAQRAVKTVTNASVWANMAMMCIKTKRLSFAEYCLGKMGHARGARAVRENGEMEEEDARVGYAALHLNMKEDALALFAGCGRYDLVNKLHQACGEWDEAISIAKAHDRIHLKNTHYAYARHLEDCGDVEGAMREYEVAGSHGREIPRMAYEMDKLTLLEQYTAVKHVKEHVVWLARNAESGGDLAEAVRLYQSADDAVSLVRLHCVQEDYEAAERVVEESGSKAAAFQLARQYENIDSAQKAIRYYSRSGRLSGAIRLAKAFGMGSELLSLSLQTTPLLALEAAEWLEQDGQYEHAVTLYQKFGRRSKALALCFEKELFDSLRAMADELGAGDDPAMLQRCANFFTSHGQYEKAVHLFISAREYGEALELCTAHNVLISEEMAEKMTPEKGSLPDEDRTALLKRIAKVCKVQGAFQVACKKFAQAGERHKAMNVLLKSGDTEKIILFAQVSRQRELYVMAANYLQTMDWHSNPDVMKSVVQLYTKARAMESLCSFYESCAQFEVDEFRDYEKAVAALREASNAMTKSQAYDKAERLMDLDRRIEWMNSFLEARSFAKEGDPDKMIETCSALIDKVPGGTGVRVGDVFALMIEYYYSTRKIDEAFALIQEMKKRGIDRAPYLGSDIIEAIYDDCANPGGSHEEDVADEDEDAEEHMYRFHGGEDDGIEEELDSDGVDEDIAEDDDDL